MVTVVLVAMRGCGAVVVVAVVVMVHMVVGGVLRALQHKNHVLKATFSRRMRIGVRISRLYMMRLEWFKSPHAACVESTLGVTAQWLW